MAWPGHLAKRNRRSLRGGVQARLVRRPGPFQLCRGWRLRGRIPGRTHAWPRALQPGRHGLRRRVSQQPLPRPGQPGICRRLQSSRAVQQRPAGWTGHPQRRQWSTQRAFQRGQPERRRQLFDRAWRALQRQLRERSVSWPGTLRGQRGQRLERHLRPRRTERHRHLCRQRWQPLQRAVSQLALPRPGPSRSRRRQLLYRRFPPRTLRRRGRTDPGRRHRAAR